MQTYRCTIARTPREIADAQRVRWQVYGEEEKLLPASACVDGREIDARDGDASTVHFVVHAGEEMVGTVRLLDVDARTGMSRGGRIGLDLESKFDLAALAAHGIVPAEITRYCVLRAYRCTGVTPALFTALRAESERRGITHWVAGANMETDVPEDAAIAYRVAREKSLVSARFHAGARGPAAPPSRGARPYYTEEQRQSARAGDLTGLDLPRTLSVFARRMGARFIGAPAYDAHFNVFALPLVATLADVRLWTNTTYPVSPTGANAARRPPPSSGGGS